jgi:alkanesulfonate monooxygenase SsuD/methylene tetrahydromethanopterin reductase-like flavin-dependent oxidoreductase (luciferase family)
MAESGMDGETPRWSDILAIARRAEELGFDSVFVADHLLYRFEGRDTFGIWEGMSLLAALAAATERIELGAGVICTGFRSPALLAKMADVLSESRRIDEISAGRLILGILRLRSGPPAGTIPSTRPSASRPTTSSAALRKPCGLSNRSSSPARSISRGNTTPPASARCDRAARAPRGRR